jgi:hypothetical protein
MRLPAWLLLTLPMMPPAVNRCNAWGLCIGGKAYHTGEHRPSVWWVQHGQPSLRCEPTRPPVTPARPAPLPSAAAPESVTSDIAGLAILVGFRKLVALPLPSAPLQTFRPVQATH